MAHFVELKGNRVIRTLVVNNDVLKDENGDEQEQLGIDFLKSLLGGEWLQTSYNGTFRKNFAGPGMLYDKNRDAFVETREGVPPSWVFDEDTCRWKPPIDRPEDGLKLFKWDEPSVSWKEVNA